MSIAKYLTSALSASLLFGVALPSAQASNPQTCVFDKYAPVAVAPYVSENSIDYGSYSSLGGAQLFVPAREGLTKEWLQASVQQGIAAGQAVQSEQPDNAATCETPHLKNVRVTVVSGGNGFWVQLVSGNEQDSQALLKWAREVVDQHKR